MSKSLLNSVTPPSLERRKIPRVAVSRVWIKFLESGTLFQVFDISSHGCGITLFEANDVLAFPVGCSLRAQLRIVDQDVPIEVKVAAISKDRVGFEWSQPIPVETEKKLRDFFSPKAVADSLQPWPMPPTQGIQWFHSNHGVDWLLSGNTGSESEWLLLFFGQFVEWRRETGIRTGHYHIDEERRRTGGQALIHFESLGLEFDSPVDRNKLAWAKDLLARVSPLHSSAEWALKSL